MNLYINSPAYYSQFCCIDDEIYSFCLKIRKNIDITQYTQNLESIGITPIIAPLEELEKGKWGEIKIVSKKYKYADISLQIDYVKYSLADISNKNLNNFYIQFGTDTTNKGSAGKFIYISDIYGIK